MSEETLVMHCAPTLAGIKTGNLFSCCFESERQMEEEAAYYEKLLSSKGIRVLPLRFENGKGLIYLYRPVALERDLQDKDAEEILKNAGYAEGDQEQRLSQLINRLRSEDAFPHEIGLFLSYPPEDVRGFMLNCAMHAKCVGTWKVYGDETKARETFHKYHHCRKVYDHCLKRGFTLERLTVACHQ